MTAHHAGGYQLHINGSTDVTIDAYRDESGHMTVAAYGFR